MTVATATPTGRAMTVVRPVLPFAATAAVALLILDAIPPDQIVAALRRIDLWTIAAVVLMARLYLGLQAGRWRFLLRDIGVRVGSMDAQLWLLAGQVAALLPLGQYARAIFVSRATGARLGAVTATIVVQEITYTLVLIAVAVPGSFSTPGVATTLLSSLVVAIGLLVLLVVPAAFRAARRCVAALPFSDRLLPTIDSLHEATSVLLRRRYAYLHLPVVMAYSAVYVSILWLIAEDVAPGSLSWTAAAFVCGVSHLASAVTAIPGGLGAYEAAVIGLLVSVGVAADSAAATAILFTLVDRGVTLLLGIAPYLIVERRYRRQLTRAQALTT
jgi:uncharacterized protein (TIRG00374 family)